MAKEEGAPAWRNFAAWSAVGAIICVIIIWGSSSLLHDKGIGAMFRSAEVMAKVGLAVIFAAAFIGFSSRKRPVSLRNVRNFVIANAAVIAIFLLAVWGFRELVDAGAMGISEWTAAGVGLAVISVALFGSFALWNAHIGATLMDLDSADDLRERSRLLLYSFAWMAASGLLLICLSLAGPLLSPAVALAVALVLIAVLVAAAIAVSRLSDELDRTLSNEAGTIAFYLIQLFGGGWAMLAHLGFVPAPAPLDWLTMFTVLMFVASFIAAGRRKLLTR